MTRDRWTHLPDDERLFSYEKYLSCDNYQLKYNPAIPKIAIGKKSNSKNSVFVYERLKNEIVFVFPVILLPDFSDSVIFAGQMATNQSSVFRYYKISKIYLNQLNGYRYCWNNPLKYIDPTGNAWDEKDWYVNSDHFSTS
jgi:hypothetical protein